MISDFRCPDSPCCIHASLNWVPDRLTQLQPPAEFLSNAPKDAPAVRIGFVSAGVGYGLFAARDLCKDEFVFHEAPIIVAPFNGKFAADERLMREQLAAYRAALADSHDELVTAYPALAAGNGIAPSSFEAASPILSHALGKYLVHGRFAGSTITPEQYRLCTSRLHVGDRADEEACRRTCLDFFAHYAFETQKGSGHGTGGVLFPPVAATTTAAAAASTATTRDACIYLLGSLTNHCCTPPMTLAGSTSRSREAAAAAGPNCSFRIGPSGLAHFVKPKHLCVQAKRDIKEGEQLTWDYGKRKRGFVCECSTCRGTVSYYCRVL